MFDFEVSVSPAAELLREIRGKVKAIREPVFAAARGPIRDKVLGLVRETMAVYPGPVIHPFVFATDRSWRWYIWAKRTGFFPGQGYDQEGGEWDRSGILFDSWGVDVNVRANENFMVIHNAAVDDKGDSYAQAVYGPNPVQGHAQTGWDEGFDEYLAYIADEVLVDIADAAVEAVIGFK